MSKKFTIKPPIVHSTENTSLLDLIKIVNTYFSEKLGLHEHKPTAISLLKKTIDILNEFNIDYFLISGTLLGYVRHNGFIPWDTLPAQFRK